MKTSVLAYIPVIHSGYVGFFKKNLGDIWILGMDMISDYVYLTRDLRMIDPEHACTALRSLFPDRRIRIADRASLNDWPYTDVIMPDDEVCRDLASKYFKGKEVKFSSVFLRWNKIITLKEYDIPAGRKITKARFHREMMALANEEAGKSSDWWRQIATVAVNDGKIIYKDHNHHLPSDFHLSVNGDPRSNFDAGQHQDIFTSIHSEAAVVAMAAREGISLKGAIVYVTTFPCPNCARLISKAGIKRVYYSKGYSLFDARKILDHFEVEVVLVQ